MHDVTQMLRAVQAGDEGSADRLFACVYDELRRLASWRMSGESNGITLQPTALVHEAWIRLGGDAQPDWKSRAHFFGAAGEAMRRILVDRARRRLTRKRGGGAEVVPLGDLDVPALSVADERLLDLDDALGRLAQLDPRKAELVKLRYFVGLGFPEAADALGIAVPTAKQWWAFAKAWLTVELGGGHRKE